MTAFAIQDDTPSTVTDNTVIGLGYRNGSIDNGAATFNGTCQDIVFEKASRLPTSISP